MYHFIFNFFYRYHKGGSNGRITAALAVALTLFVHIFLLSMFILHFTGYNIWGKPLSSDYFTNKLYLMPFALVYGLLFVLYYNPKRSLAVINKWPEDYKYFSIKNIFWVILIAIVPLVAAVELLQHTSLPSQISLPPLP